MARLTRERFSAVLGPKNRVKKIFIDYLRNSRGASTVAVFSARARSGMGVSMPIWLSPHAARHYGGDAKGGRPALTGAASDLLLPAAIIEHGGTIKN
ncbi:MULTISPECIES: hypothetical protein [unclassified Caballeronia]|uniref:non-homologous end-joining DNA ligase LigD n=1 Tax=unclassified Caballeronia TaxID=2646786 RepID=UPI00288C07AA|nr:MULTISPECIES: hypothetical protein [unclassified Caballeronia]